MKIYTIGYGNRQPKEFFKLLEDNNINMVIDVRREKPKAWNSAYSYDELLKRYGIGYRPYSKLSNQCESLKEYDEWLNTTSEGELAINNLLLDLKCWRDNHVVILCAELRAEQCHRKIITDFLAERDYEIHHL